MEKQCTCDWLSVGVYLWELPGVAGINYGKVGRYFDIAPVLLGNTLSVDCQTPCAYFFCARCYGAFYLSLGSRPDCMCAYIFNACLYLASSAYSSLTPSPSPARTKVQLLGALHLSLSASSRQASRSVWPTTIVWCWYIVWLRWGARRNGYRSGWNVFGSCLSGFVYEPGHDYSQCATWLGARVLLSCWIRSKSFELSRGDYRTKQVLLLDDGYSIECGGAESFVGLFVVGYFVITWFFASTFQEEIRQSKQLML